MRLWRFFAVSLALAGGLLAASSPVWAQQDLTTPAHGASDATDTPPNLLDNAQEEDPGDVDMDDPGSPAVIKSGEPVMESEGQHAASDIVPPTVAATNPVPSAAPGVATAPAVPGVPTTAPSKADGATPPPKAVLKPPSTGGTKPDLFFDAESLVPTGEMATKSQGPREVNPKTQPATGVVIVKKGAAANSIDAQLVAADRAMKLGRYDAALDMYEGMYAKNSHDPRVLMGKAVCLQYLGQYDPAMQTYQELIDAYPKNVEAKINMLGLLSTKYPAVALRELLDMQDKEPSNVGILAQIAVTEAHLGSVDDALKYLAMAASMEPNNAIHVFNMAVIADHAGKKDVAEQYYEKALEIDAVYGHSKSIPRDAVYERLSKLR